MKKQSYYLLAVLAFAALACDNKEQVPPVEEHDSVELSITEKTVGMMGDTFSVMVTSSSDWTLAPESECKWVIPSALSGSDSDVVNFEVLRNDTGEKLTCVWVFTAGKAQQTLEITSLETSLIELEKTEFVLAHTAGSVAINVKTEIPYRELKSEIRYDGEEGWLTAEATTDGDEGYDGRLNFSCAALEGLADRRAVISVSADHANTVEVTVLQEAVLVLTTEGTSFSAPSEGGTVAVPLTANVEYRVDISESGSGWLTDSGYKDGNYTFTAAPLSGDKRSAEVTFTQTDAKDGAEPLSRTITVTQQNNALINYAVRMTGNRLFPKWEGDGIADHKSRKQVTYETLVWFDDFDKGATDIMTLMGVEGKFLLRTGDVGNDIHNLQLVSGDGESKNCTFKFEPKRWYHVAATYSENDWMCRVFIDGVEQFSYESFAIYNGVKPAPEFKGAYETDNARSFWIGYSYESGRDLHGMMTEIRIWSKALTAEELQAENHFYEVDPQSEGLEAYWKFTEGQGNTIADVTGHNNPLYGETNVRKQKDESNLEIHKGDDGIEWVKVSLPDK